MVGLDFKIKNEYGDYLCKILHSVNVFKYNWEIFSDDIICDGKDGSGLFNAYVIEGNDFFSKISKNKYYLIFADLKALPTNGTRKNITSFSDFWESDYEIVLLCSDSEFIEFYCKDEDIIEVVIKNCKKNNFDSLKILSIEDARNRSMVAF